MALYCIPALTCNVPTEATFISANRETSYGVGNVPATINVGDTYTHKCKSNFTMLNGSANEDEITVECRQINHWDTLTRTTFLSITAIPNCTGEFTGANHETI